MKTVVMFFDKFWSLVMCSTFSCSDLHICGAVGYISVKTTALAEDSAVSRMVRLVEEAQSQQSRTELLMEKIAKFYTPRKE